jgi:hypothetical protein
MDLRPTQCNEKRLGSSHHLPWNHNPPLCHPACPGVPWEQPTWLRQVKGGMNMGKRCLQSRPRGPAPKISPARKGWVHRQAVERRRCGTTLFVCSLGAKPTCPGLPWGVPWRGSAVLQTLPGYVFRQSETGFPATQRYTWSRVRLSLKKAA